MKKNKIFFVVFMLTVLFCLTFAFTACTFGTAAHTHTFSSSWTYDGTHHWQACSSCDEVRNKAEHDWNEGVITLQPTETGEGVRTFTCKVCGQTKIEKIPVLTNHEHSYSNEWTSDNTHHWHQATCEHKTERTDYAGHTWNEGEVTKTPTETEAGTKTYTCTVCAKTREEEVPPIEHVHTYAKEWSKDGEYHWHASACGHESEISEKGAHTWNEGEVTKEPTETATGTKTYTCTVCAKTREEEVPPIKHVHTYATEWSKDGEYHWHASACGHENEISEKGAHTWDEGTVTKEPTETEVGTKTYSCTVCGKTRDKILPFAAHAHTYAEEWSYDDEYHWHSATCDHVAAKGDERSHSWEDTGKIIPGATDADEGEKEQKCSVCGCTRMVKTGTPGHDHEYENGWTYNEEYHWHASSCGHEAFVSEKDQHSWNDGEVTKQATVYDEGIRTYTCTVCGGFKEEYLPKIKSFSVIFLDKDNRTVSAKNYALGTVRKDIQIPTNFEYDGLQFLGWLEIASLVKIGDYNFDLAEDGDAYYFQAKYEKTYTVTFVDHNGNKLGAVVVGESNNSVSAKDFPAIPAREGYTAYWDSGALRDIKNDMTVAPVYEKISFEVVFKDPDGNILPYVNENGKVITKQIVEYGSFAIAPEYKQYYFNKTKMKLYEFSGWSASFEQVKENLVVIAQYDTLYEDPVIAVKMDGTRISVSLILPSNDTVLYSISVSLKWEVNRGTCYISDVVLRGQSALDERSDQGHKCTVGKKDEWLNYNNKSCTVDFIWNCGDGHTPNNTHYIENIFTLVYDVYDGAIFSESIFELVESSVIIYGTANDEVQNLPVSKLMIWFYE